MLSHSDLPVDEPLTAEDGLHSSVRLVGSYLETGVGEINGDLLQADS
jgi:hypothetical protein